MDIAMETTRAPASKSSSTCPESDSTPNMDKMHEENFSQLIFIVTYMRSLESAREDCVCHDPFAEPLTRQIAPQLGPHVEKWLQRQPSTAHYIGLLSEYLDEALRERDPSILQVLLLGSGLDSRAQHFAPLQDCHVLEIDQSAELFEHKKAVFEELKVSPITARLDYIVADLDDVDWDEKLLSSGFDSKMPTFWALENLFIHLSKPTKAALLKTIDVLSAPGSEIWVDVVGSSAVDESELIFLEDVNNLSKAELGHNIVKHGENDALRDSFSELPWELEIQASLSQGGIHFCREWKPLIQGKSNVPMKLALVKGKKPRVETTP